MTRLALGSALALAAVAGQAFAQSADEDARMHFRLGSAYYQSGRFQEAATEFQTAFDLSQRPQLLYNVFVAHRDAGNLAPAVDALRRYLEQVPDAADREQLTARLASMSRLVEQQAATQTTPTETQPEATEPEAQAEPGTGEAGATATEEPDVAAGPRAAELARTEPGRSPVPLVVLGSGGALILGSLITGLMASGKESDLEEMCGPDNACPPGVDFEDLASSGQTLATVTDILLIGGVVTAGVGVALWFSSGETAAEVPPEPAATAACTTQGCFGSVTVRY
jgi:tetratricopeptide (TPR) repeat protein